MRSADQLPTIARLRELLEYDAETGALKWRVDRSPARAGGPAGGVHKGARGYVQVRVHGVLLRGHRVAWALHHGAWPQGEIDHISGDRSDNRIANLRVATRAQNSQNEKRARCNNRSGLFGVSAAQSRPKPWQARINVDGKDRHLGCFETKEAAHAAYLSAKRELHPFAVLPEKKEAGAYRDFVVETRGEFAPAAYRNS